MSNLGKVQSIRECYWQKGWFTFEGYEIITDSHTFKVLIENRQQCCENWGYFSSNDEPFERFIGKKLMDVRLTDTALNTKTLDELGLCFDSRLVECDIQFVDFVFSDGDVLQLAVYNEHNGYYGHDILVTMDSDVIKEGCL